MTPFFPTRPDNYFTFGGVSSEDYYTWISGVGTYDAPERDVTTVSIPGRSGDLLMDNGRFKNMKLTYPCFMPRDFNDTWWDTFKGWLLSDTNYKRLEDTYNPEYYRMAYCTGPIKPSTGPGNRSGAFDVVFNCKPQKWLKSGEIMTTYTATANIYNPTNYPAKPLLRLKGTGTVAIEFGPLGDKTNNSIVVNSQPDNNPYIDVDCEMQDAYHGSNGNRNSCITVSDDFPYFAPGWNELQITGLTSVRVTPRWWTI